MSSAAQRALGARSAPCADCGRIAFSIRCVDCSRLHLADKRAEQTTLRFFDRFEEDPETGCWLWQGAIDSSYGRFQLRGRRVLAHRFSYEAFIGAIPDGLQLDHLCRTPRCVNPGHLEPVTARENTLRGESLPAANAAKTHCKRGHRFDEANTRHTPDGRRICRICDRAKGRKHYLKKRAAAPLTRPAA